jgi:hypothetical protein
VSKHLHRNAPINERLHPALPRVLIGCILWTLLALAVVFGGDRYAALQIAVVAVFAAAFVGTPMILMQLERRHAPQSDDATPSLRDWLDQDFAAGDVTIRGWDAACMILCVPVFCTAGMTAMAALVAVTLASMP